MKSPKQEEIENLQKFILEELNRISTPLELMATDDKEKLEKATVLWKVNKILENFDALEPNLKSWFRTYTKKEQYDEREI